MNQSDVDKRENIQETPKDTHTYSISLSLGKVVGWHENTVQPLSTGVQATREGRKDCTLSLTNTHTYKRMHTARTDTHGDSLTCNFGLEISRRIGVKGACSGSE